MDRTYRARYKNINLSKLFFLLLILLLPISLIWLIVHPHKQIQVSKSIECNQKMALKLIGNVPQTLVGDVEMGQLACFTFHANAGQIISLSTNTTVFILKPDNSSLTIQGKSRNVLSSNGDYLIRINAGPRDIKYQIRLLLESKVVAARKSNEEKSKNLSVHTQLDNTKELQLSYNVTTPPSFNLSKKLQDIVDNIINSVQLKGLPIEKLSISLIDLSDSNCCTYASYLDGETRYPASIVKLFWMVELYNQYKAKTIPEETALNKELYKMIQDSSNESASRILDKISRTESGKDLPRSKLDNWIARRYSVNQFFKQAGYQNINISQKPFPIPYLNLDRPQGRDLQIRYVSGNEAKPVRNYLTTYSVARLLFEIYTNQAVGSQYSTQMKALLKRDLHPEYWKQKPYNSIAGFLGQSLPVTTNFYSKMGWTFSNRNDAAIIATPDGKHKYILVLFGDDPSFYKDKKLFPEISRMIYQEITHEEL